MMLPLAQSSLAAVLLSSMLLTGCVGWSPAAAPAPRASAADTVAVSPARMRVWTGERGYELREAIWRNDSLVGQENREGTTVGLARSAVDSVSVRGLRPTATFLLFTGVVAGTGLTIVGLYAIACASGGCD